MKNALLREMAGIAPEVGHFALCHLGQHSFLLKLGDANLVDGFMTGAVKFKPYMQLALTTVKGVMTMTIAIRGNDEDKKIVEGFFDLIIGNMKDFVELNKDKLN